MRTKDHGVCFCFVFGLLANNLLQGKFVILASNPQLEGPGSRIYVPH
jgi:hypothetical protein